MKLGAGQDGRRGLLDGEGVLGGGGAVHRDGDFDLLDGDLVDGAGAGVDGRRDDVASGRGGGVGRRRGGHGGLRRDGGLGSGSLSR